MVGGDVDDVAAAADDDVGDGGTARVKHAAKVCVHHVVPIGDSLFPIIGCCEGGPPDTGVRDEDVDPAELGRRTVDEPAHVRGDAHVGHEAACPGASRRLDGAGTRHDLGPDVAEGNGGASCREHPRDAIADAVGPAGDNRNLARECSHWFFPSVR